MSRYMYGHIWSKILDQMSKILDQMWPYIYLDIQLGPVGQEIYSIGICIGIYSMYSMYSMYRYLFNRYMYGHIWSKILDQMSKILDQMWPYIYLDIQLGPVGQEIYSIELSIEDATTTMPAL